VSDGGRKLGGVSAEQVHHQDPYDPEVILERLPAQERAEFLRQYQEAVEAAHDPAGYKRLRQVLHMWSLAVVATSRSGYYEDLGAVRMGTARTVPAETAVPYWEQRLAAARARPR
jgi:Family of unknown function (DUF6247)